ncbi:hypothetical protein TRVA0_001S04390 [Trichomonascus vanleenenianus]|uniref:uncharacterized protein n=1 Tax=Trichomonascus vanleenenianus TaxID=2268995 RepID=UPI003EC9F90F
MARTASKRLAFGGLSLILGAVTIQSFRTQANVLTTALLNLLRANPWTIVICNSAFVILVLFSRLFQTFLFGPLKPEELSQLSARIWYTVVEFSVAFVIVGESITLYSMALLTLSLVVKWFHWLSAVRVERFSSQPFFGQAKFVVALALLHIVDIQWLKYYFDEIVVRRQHSMLTVILGFESCIMYHSLLNTTAQFLLSNYERLYLFAHPDRTEWARKEKYLFGLNLASDVFKLIMYMFFSALLLTHYYIPIHIFREAYLALRLSITKTRELIWYKNMSASYPAERFSSPSHDDLRGREVCLICREEMSINQDLAKANCGHVMHYACLFAWLRQTTSCPVCRAQIS